MLQWKDQKQVTPPGDAHDQVQRLAHCDSNPPLSRTGQTKKGEKRLRFPGKRRAKTCLKQGRQQPVRLRAGPRTPAGDQARKNGSRFATLRYPTLPVMHRNHLLCSRAGETVLTSGERTGRDEHMISLESHQCWWINQPHVLHIYYVHPYTYMVCAGIVSTAHRVLRRLLALVVCDPRRNKVALLGRRVSCTACQTERGPSAVSTVSWAIALSKDPRCMDYASARKAR